MKHSAHRVLEQVVQKYLYPRSDQKYQRWFEKTLHGAKDVWKLTGRLRLCGG